ncbi:unnamed protein product [Parajaminaea phylloscopi]
MARIDIADRPGDTVTTPLSRPIHPVNSARGSNPPRSTVHTNGSTPLRKSGDATAVTGSSGRARVDMSTVAASATPPLLKRNPATTPNVMSPFLQSQRNLAANSTSSAPSTPSLSGPPVRSASPDSASKGSPFYRGNVPPNVTIRSPTGSRAKVRESSDNASSPLQGSVSMLHSSATLPSLTSVVGANRPQSNGRLSPVRGHARSATVQKAPTAATLHATPAQARMADVTSPALTGGQSSRTAVSPGASVSRPPSPIRPGSPTHSQARVAPLLGTNVRGQPQSSPFQRHSGSGLADESPRVPKSSTMAALCQEEPQRRSHPPRPQMQASMTASLNPAARRASVSSTPMSAELPASQSRTCDSLSMEHATTTIPRSAATSAGRPTLPQWPKSETLHSASAKATLMTLGNDAGASVLAPLANRDGLPSTSASTAWSTPPPALLSPTSETSSSNIYTDGQNAAGLEYATLRVERKIADLEITNKSLMAINSGLEVTKHRQQRELRDLRKRLRDGRGLSPGSVDREDASRAGRRPFTSAAQDDATLGSDDDDADDDSLSDLGALPPREDPELEAAHQRCKALIDAMLDQARTAILSSAPADVREGSGVKVLSVGEVREIEEADRLEEEGGMELSRSFLPLQSAADSHDVSFATDTADDSTQVTLPATPEQLNSPRSMGQGRSVEVRAAEVPDAASGQNAANHEEAPAVPFSAEGLVMPDRAIETSSSACTGVDYDEDHPIADNVPPTLSVGVSDTDIGSISVD